MFTGNNFLDPDVLELDSPMQLFFYLFPQEQIQENFGVD